VAEGVLKGTIAGEEEKPEVEAAEALVSADAFAVAVAAKLAGNDPEVARHTSAFLKKQTELLSTQNKHLKDEHALRLAHLRHQLSEENVRRFGLRLRVSFQLFIVLAAIVIVISAVIMVRDAVTSRNVVIEPFDTPPTLASDGLNGKVLASGLLDVLTRIQAATRSSAEHRSLSNGWTNDIAVEVPETGITIGQLERILKIRFGHDQHIDGELMRTSTGELALTVRGTGILSRTFAGEAPALDTLLREAGEYIYGQSQPGLWANYLFNTGRYDDAIRFCQASYATASPGERPYVLNYWADAIAGKGGAGANREALLLWQETVRLKPDFWIGYHNIQAALGGLGDEEGLVRAGKQMMKIAGGRPGRVPEDLYGNYDNVVWDLPAERAGVIADIESYGFFGTLGAPSGAANFGLAQIEVQMHDLDAARLRLKTTPVDEKNAPDVALAAFDRALLAEAEGDLKAAAREWDVLALAYTDPTVSTNTIHAICSAAVTYERTGQSAKADAALKPVGNFPFVDCYRFEGDVLDLRGDWSGAQEWYARAVKLGPSIPSGYYSWGVALAKHGDLEGAAAKFKDANEKGPHWADPLKAWGMCL
jgi:tetratricopeptide (TPR) repeat protein